MNYSQVLQLRKQAAGNFISTAYPTSSIDYAPAQAVALGQINNLQPQSTPISKNWNYKDTARADLFVNNNYKQMLNGRKDGLSTQQLMLRSGSPLSRGGSGLLGSTYNKMRSTSPAEAANAIGFLGTLGAAAMKRNPYLLGTLLTGTYMAPKINLRSLDTFNGMARDLSMPIDKSMNKLLLRELQKKYKKPVSTFNMLF